jgi:hypothetical protein
VVFPEPRPIQGKRLVPQLAVGCFLFTLLGLLGTYLAAKPLQGFLAKHPIGNHMPEQ